MRVRVIDCVCATAHTCCRTLTSLTHSGDLAHHLERNGAFSEKEVRFIAAEIVLGLEHLHSCGIVYRCVRALVLK